jgi:hypothetical protein
MKGEMVLRMSKANFSADPKQKWEDGWEGGRVFFVTGVGLNQRTFTVSGINVVSMGQDMDAHWLGHRLPVDTTSYLRVVHI